MKSYLFHFLVEVVFYTVCGWIGSTFVRLLTFGRVDLDWREGSESVLAEWIGLAVLVGVILLVAVFWPRPASPATPPETVFHQQATPISHTSH